jgi:5-methylcytosine-specific restriction endonuclease McrA
MARIRSPRRRKIPDALRAQVWERDGSHCRQCGKLVRRNKVDRYDSGDDLAEIDHTSAVAGNGGLRG